MRIEEIIKKIQPVDISNEIDFSRVRMISVFPHIPTPPEALRDNFSINIMSFEETAETPYIRYCSLSEHQSFQVGSPIDGPPDFMTHQHDFYEMMYVYKGRPRQQIEEDSGSCEEGEFYLLNKNIKHVECYDGLTTCVFLCFKEDFLIGLLQELAPHSPIRNFFEDNMSHASVRNKQYMYFRHARAKSSKRALNSLIVGLAKELLEKKPGFRHCIYGLIVRLFCELERPGAYHTLYKLHDAGSQLFQQVARYIRAENGCVSREQLSARFHYHADYLNRIFKQQASMSLTEYFNMVRLEKAKTMLACTALSVWEIADALGFQNKSYFYRLFERENGVTPGTYRKEHMLCEKSE